MTYVGGLLGGVLGIFAGLAASVILCCIPAAPFYMCVGAGVGLGARYGSGQTGGLAIAAGRAFSIMFVGHVALVAYGFSLYQEELIASGEVDLEEITISFAADDVAKEMEARGEFVGWPEHAGIGENAASEEDYPADVWAEAVRRWDAWSEDERAYNRDKTKRDMDPASNALQAAFDALFENPLCLLVMVLCVGIAGNVGMREG